MFGADGDPWSPFDCKSQNENCRFPCCPRCWVAMTALFIAWYSFVRNHQTLKTTPAVAAGIASEKWTLERLLMESAKTMAA
jgi:hypothetical protein